VEKTPGIHAKINVPRDQVGNIDQIIKDVSTTLRTGKVGNLP
jgi:hypothetical protein